MRYKRVISWVGGLGTRSRRGVGGWGPLGKGWVGDRPLVVGGWMERERGKKELRS